MTGPIGPRPRKANRTDAFAAALLDRAEIEHHRFISGYGSMTGRLAPGGVPALMRLFVERHLHLLLQEMMPGTDTLLDYDDDDDAWTRDTPASALMVQPKGRPLIRIPIRWSNRGRTVTFKPPQAAPLTVILTAADGGEHLAQALTQLVAGAIRPDNREAA